MRPTFTVALRPWSTPAIPCNSFADNWQLRNRKDGRSSESASADDLGP